jgi:hypothetical protein
VPRRSCSFPKVMPRRLQEARGRLSKEEMAVVPAHASHDLYNVGEGHQVYVRPWFCHHPISYGESGVKTHRRGSRLGSLQLQELDILGG